MAILSNTNNSDSIGALASGLCLMHCIATPFIFVAQTCAASCCETAPTWWQSIDFLFIGVSFFAVFWSVKFSSKQWIKHALWASWFLLSAFIINEKVEFIHSPEWVIYLPATALIILHLYNRKYCQCENECC
ncbi:MerC domain-containing protein [Psychroserpens sp.]|uniref:MerC domain-containing protein n=1 Tax=Psychroserpens sp. TaxID=2020870 RepID=UPI001B1343C4|nr:MerC domain-containing protein [Psychroserpens sp.]MBO6607341.1 MerC domain-containing protein [Psychroserpens sp.]MBO6630803.1 MerC domain-containing protein [Psychroserpens sp.]MBO6654583.1 MerC domain-containing protein [Psychroserpens sp.]MBO6681070.1 MerC domain-containing protein [Psychroserpens sp.]MBO6749975.1 MerC domain-containing protein [Psychroserpens sp.]